jgi:class 3 adenylate cyclase/tetratricopeptide (TPR) repeat protein
MDSFRARLAQHGLGKYAALFAEHGIDLDVVADLTDADLEKLGVALGDRRRILKAARTIAGNPSALAASEGRQAERRQLTVMFADLVNSTKLAVLLDPEDMKDLIARYQQAVSDQITRFGGYVAKPLGDGLLIYFGWPEAHEDDAERAVRSGLAVVAAVQRLYAPNGVALATRIGIATGEVVVGNFTGAGVDEEGAVVGEAPTLAARLQTVASENGIVVAEETHKLVGRQFAFADLGEQQLKGFDKPDRTWRVDGERASESRFDAMHGARTGAFVGREHEIGMLLQRWEDATDGECQLVLIAGEAGIGKSRLVAECLGRVERRARRITYQGSPLHANTALYPVVRQLQSRARFGPTDTAAEKWRKLDAALPSELPRRILALQFLAELMSLEVPGKFAAGATVAVDEQKEAAFEVLADAAKKETELTPLLIVVEDAHWLDATTQEFIERLLDRLQRCPTMVLVTYRPEFVPPWAQHANVGLLSLSRLGKRDARAIIDSLLTGGQNIPREIAEEIVVKGDGNPLFVQELTGSVLEASRMGDDRSIQIPATLRDSLSERLDRLGSAKEVAQIAAAFGREFAIELVAAVLDRRGDDLQVDLDRLVAIDVVFESSHSGRRYTFRHALLQEAAYESLLKSKRREVHARIAEVLRRLRPEMAETEPEVLAIHLAGAGDRASAAECWQKAGHINLRNSAYREAIGAFKNALGLMSEPTKARADTNRAIASAYFAAGDHNPVREHLEHAATDAEAAGDQVMMAEIAMQQGHDLIQYGGSMTEAIRFSERALDIATRLDDEALAYGARFSIGQAYWITGHFAEGIRVLTANLPENLHNPERVRDFGTTGSLMMDSLSILGACYAYRGDFGQSTALLTRALGLVTSAAFDFSVVQYHLNRAHLQRGDAAIALPLLVKAVRHATEAGLKFTLPWHLGLLGYARGLLGDIDQGAEDLARAITESEQLGLPQVKVFASGFLAELLVGREQQQALELADKALTIARANGYRAQEAELLRVKGAALGAINPVEAVALVNEGLDLARGLGMRPEEGHAFRVLSDIEAGSGGASAAAGESRDQARAIYRDLGMKYWLERMG